MVLTPGINFLAKTAIPVVFGPPIVVHIFLIWISQFWQALSPTPALLSCIYILSLPAHLIVLNRLSRLQQTRAALRLGARITPTVDGMLPGNIDLLYKTLRADKYEYLGESWIRLTKQHGMTFALKFLEDQRICTLNAKNIQKILVTDFEKYRKGGFFSIIAGSMLGVGVFNSDGDMWQFHRKMTRPFFSKERVTDLLLYERKTAIALQKMQDKFDDGFAVDFQDLVSRFTLDSAAEFLLGASVNSLDSPLPFPFYHSESREEIESTSSTRFARAFAAAQVTILNRMKRSSLWPLAEIFEDKMESQMVEIRSFIEPIVRNAIHKRGQGEEQDEQTLLGHLLDVTDDMKIIVDETLNILVAGRDTTASLLTFVTYCLATHPNVLSRLRDEIIDSIGSFRAPNYGDIRDMRYLRAVLNETLRLFPPVPFNLRETVVETTLMDDEGQKIYVPANARIGLSFLHIHRSETYWGPDAHIFDPDRWLDSRVSKYTSNPFIFVPFNAGPRICIGQQFAYHEASFFLVRLLQRFENIELARESQPPETRPPASWENTKTAPQLGMRRPLEQCFPRAHLTLYADGGLWIRARKAEGV